MSLNKSAEIFLSRTVILTVCIMCVLCISIASAQDTEPENEVSQGDGVESQTPVVPPSPFSSAPVLASPVSPSPVSPSPVSPSLSESSKSRGEYLVKVAACGYCHGQVHNDPESPLSGGLEIVDSYGSVKVPNITSDLTSGIGGWTESQVMNAIRASVGKNGERLSIDSHESYRWLADEDVRQMARYLLKTRSVENNVERRSITNFTSRKWGLFSQHEPVKGYVPVLSRKAGGYYGFYLVHMVAGCARCHSPGEQSFEKVGYLNGGESSAFKAVPSDVRSMEITAPSIRNQDGGIVHWGDEDLLDYLKSGKSITKSVGAKICPQPYYSQLNEQDRKSIVSYLRSLQ